MPHFPNQLSTMFLLGPTCWIKTCNNYSLDSGWTSPFLSPFLSFHTFLPFLPFLSSLSTSLSLPFVHTLSLPSFSIHHFYSSSLLFPSSPLPLRTCVLHPSIIYSHPLCTISIGKADAKSKQARAMDLTPKPVHRQN